MSNRTLIFMKNTGGELVDALYVNAAYVNVRGQKVIETICNVTDNGNGTAKVHVVDMVSEGLGYENGEFFATIPVLQL